MTKEEMDDPKVQEILEKKESGETLSRQEAGVLGGKAYKAAQRAEELGGEKHAIEDILEKQKAHEPLTAHERGKLGGSRVSEAVHKMKEADKDTEEKDKVET
ncbi:hypothetical protein Pelo_4652 [Pelomyxa schiedti]|nr:hypothetical protein Pelo_4652 [Pelomyxa schiedti]